VYVMASQATENVITLKGSAEIIAEFFQFGVHNILYQRGIYPPESFERVQKYDIALFETTDKNIKEYFDAVLDQLKEWLEKGKVSKLVLAIANAETKDILETWNFKIEHENSPATNGESGEKKSPKKKSQKEIQEEIRCVMRQITASVSFLPLLDCVCAFNILIHTSKDAETNDQWAEHGPCIINDAEEVKLKSFSTSLHKVSTSVTFCRSGFGPAI